MQFQSSLTRGYALAGKAAEGGAKDGKTNGVEQEKLKIRYFTANSPHLRACALTLRPCVVCLVCVCVAIRISLKDKSKDAAATDRKPPENGEKSKEKEKAKDKADREKEGAGGKERAGKKERATKIVFVDLLQPLPLATRTYVRRNKLRCLALTFLSPPPSQTPIDHPYALPVIRCCACVSCVSCVRVCVCVVSCRVSCEVRVRREMTRR